MEDLLWRFSLCLRLRQRKNRMAPKITRPTTAKAPWMAPFFHTSPDELSSFLSGAPAALSIGSVLEIGEVCEVVGSSELAEKVATSMLATI